MFRFFDQFSILYRMAIGFAVLIILLCIQFLLFDTQNKQLSSIHDRLIRHPFTVTRATLHVDKRVLELRLHSDLLLTTKDPEEVRKIEQHLQQAWGELQKQLEVVRERFLGDMDRVRETQLLLETWWHLLQREVILILENRSREVVTQRASPEYRARMERIDQNILYVTEFAQNKKLQLANEFDETILASRKIILLFFSGIILFGFVVAAMATRAIARPLREMNDAVTQIAAKEFSRAVPGTHRQDEFGTLARSITILQGMARRIDEEVWIKSQVNFLSLQLQQITEPAPFAHQVIHHLAGLLAGVHGACYLYDEERHHLALQGGFALEALTHTRASIAVGEGLVGLCAQNGEIIHLNEVPPGYLNIASSLGESEPRHLLLAPLKYQERTLGVVELAAFQPFTPLHHTLLESILPVIAINLESLNRLQRTRHLLNESRHQAQLLRQSHEELRTQGEELRTINETLRSKSAILEQQTMELRRSEEELISQGEALQLANEALLAKNETMERHAIALQEARQAAERTAAELELASRYKSEFLANMSHELRTPLNSLLILARSLATNPEGNLNDDQKESAQIIHDSGQDLLHLINDILDLAKVESGRMETTREPIQLTQLLTNLERRFNPLARDKGLELSMRILPETPDICYSDPHKLGRILANLVANAIKFTDHGQVSLTVQAEPVTDPQGHPWLALAVRDTGIGIPAGQEERIFQAFRQLDGTTSRRHGGTGLGLTIARELAKLLGGRIQLVSTPGEGSTFTLLLPLLAPPDNAGETPTARDSAPPVTGPHPVPTEPPSRLLSEPSRQSAILIIEDDPIFARILGELSRTRGFTPILAADGEQGLMLAARHRPDGVILDLTLPGMDGLNVLRQLKAEAATRAIPVHVISARDDVSVGLAQGASEYWVKPVSREQIETVLQRIARQQGTLEPRHVLVIEDDPQSRRAIAMLLESAAVKTTCVAKAEEALARLDAEPFCCMVLDLNLRGMSGFDLLERASRENKTLPPVIVYSGRVLNDQETLRLRQYTDHIIIKGERSPERLQEEVALFLHQVQSNVGRTARPEAPAFNASIHFDPILKERTILIVDDDMRNIFALSKALRARGLQVLMAQDGMRALTQLHNNPQVELVIMDIMMPEMDGYAAMQAIRAQERWHKVPILAMTAKAMSGEREKCLQAGADDYLSKPVDLDRLIARMHHWLTPPS
ncbi:MAG: response regulator [Magnetococcales bacterium]|nr:response regulator [Magnetococcales bacterium]